MKKERNVSEIVPGTRKNGPRIETMSTGEGVEVSCSPPRGGIITSLKMGGKEILYMDEETFLNEQVNVRGGIPILFPNAGPNESSAFPKLKQHGFARTSAQWTYKKESGNNFIETLEADESTKDMYPYDFRFAVMGCAEHNGSFTLVLRVENREPAKKLPVSMGLHPYFRIPNKAKHNIEFDFEGGKYVEAEVERWSNGDAISIDNPKVNDPTAVLNITLPTIGTLVLDVDPTYRKIFVWSLPEKDFICIEPFVRGFEGLVNDPALVKPGATLSARVNLALKDVQ